VAKAGHYAFADKLSCFNAANFQGSVITLKKVKTAASKAKVHDCRTCGITVLGRFNVLKTSEPSTVALTRPL